MFMVLVQDRIYQNPNVSKAHIWNGITYDECF